MSLKNAVSEFSHLRVYKMLSTPSILNLVACNRIMKIKPLVANASKLYRASKMVFGTRLTDLVVQKTFCEVLTAGNTLAQAQAASHNLRNQGTSRYNYRHFDNVGLLCLGSRRKPR